MSDETRDIIVERIVKAVAEVEERDPKNLDICLYHDISMDALQGLVAHESNAWRLQFETENHVVEVTGNNTILVDGEPM